MNETTSKLIRRATVVTLYAIDAAELSESEALEAMPEALRDEYGSEIDTHWADVQLAVSSVLSRLDELNGLIQVVSPRWKIERMASVDRTILRVGAWEILFANHAPLEVINSCVDLAKEYGEKSTPAFVNGLLDQLCQNHDISIA